MDDPIETARRLGLEKLAGQFSDAVQEAADAAARMKAGFRRDLPPAAEPCTIQVPPQS